MLSDLQLVYMGPRNSTELLKINTTKFQVEREPVYKSPNKFGHESTGIYPSPIEHGVIYKMRHRGVARIWKGGGQEIFFCQIWKFACREARGVRGHAPPRNFFKMVQFGAFWCVF